LLFVSAATELGYRACASAQESSTHRPWIEALLMGGCIGAAVASKYVALPAMALPLLFWPRLRLPLASLAVTASLVVPLPWFLFNFIGTGNPLYPLFTDVGNQLGSFRGSGSEMEQLTWWLGRPGLVDDSLGAFLPLSFLVALAVWPRARGWLRPILALAALYLLAALVYQPTLRSFSILILVASMAGGAALSSLLSRSRTVRRLTLIGVTLAAALDLAAVLYVLQEYRPVSTVIGVESTDKYLGTGVRYYAAFRKIEGNTLSNEGVLVVGESRIFHLQRPAIAASYLDPHPIRSFRSDCASGNCLDSEQAVAEEARLIAGRLRDAGISIIYLDEEQYHVESAAHPRPELVSETAFYVTEQDDRLFRQVLASHARELSQDRGIKLYQLLP
jgi:hypothetical protein